MPKTKDDWCNRFTQSLRAWSELPDKLKNPMPSDHFVGSLDHAVDSFMQHLVGVKDEDIILLPALRALMHQALERNFRDIEVAWGRCESPIEAPMLFALVIVGRALGLAVVLKVDSLLTGDRDESEPELLVIEPQAVLGEHRVDFQLILRASGPDFDHPVKASNGSTIPGVKEVERKMILECDGHDFHDRTKEQARKDRSRDRFLQSLGYRVFRYTGSEIWRDVFKCAHEALTTLHREIEKDIY